LNDLVQGLAPDAMHQLAVQLLAMTWGLVPIKSLEK
jgi:hypothetical protein